MNGTRTRRRRTSKRTYILVHSSYKEEIIKVTFDFSILVVQSNDASGGDTQR